MTPPLHPDPTPPRLLSRADEILKDWAPLAFKNDGLKIREFHTYTKSLESRLTECERVREAADKVILAGMKMSNICFNSAQLDGLPERLTRAMKEGQREWDLALPKLRSALSTTTTPTEGK